MSKTEKCRFCKSCTKEIHDFRTWKTTEIKSFVEEQDSDGKAVCGILKTEQIQRYFTKYAKRKGDLHPQLKFVATLLLLI